MGVTVEAAFDEDGTQIFFELFDMALGPVGLPVLVGDVADRIIGAIGEGFEFEGVPAIAGEGNNWKELTWFTIQEREHAGFPGKHPINERTGAMKDALMQNPTPRAEGPTEYSAVIPERTTPFLETKLLTAQEGDVFSKTVARPVLPAINDAEAVILTEVAEASLQDTLNQLYGVGS